MDSHYSFTGSAYPFNEDMFPNDTFARTEDNLTDVSMSYMDSKIDPYLGHWDLSQQQQLGVQRYLEDSQNTAYFNADIPSRMTPSRALMRPAIGIPILPSVSHVRFASPISSPEPSSSSDSMRSPPADTDSHYESFPSPAPDPASLQLFQQPPQYDQPWTTHAHAVQFMAMGPHCVNPNDVNPNSQPPDCFEDDSNTKVDFSFPQRGYSLESYTTSQCDMEPIHDAAALDLPARRLASPDAIQPVAEEEIKERSSYPPPPRQTREAETEESDGEPLQPAQKRRKSDEDGDYKASTKAPPNLRRQSRRSSKSQQAALSGSPLRTVEPMPKRAKTSQNDTGRVNTTSQQPPAKALPLSTSGGKGTYTCPDCSHSPFKDQTNLDSHIKKQHTRPFICVFHFAGCESTFASKNEWKRHVSSQHLLLNYWRCDEGPCAGVTGKTSTNGPSALQVPPSGSVAGRSSRSSRNTSTVSGNTSAVSTPVLTPSSEHTHTHSHSNNNNNSATGVIFNRKDLYTQHVRRMHMPPQIKKTLKQQHQSTPSSSSHKKPSSATPSGPTSHPEWEDRLRTLQSRAIRSRCSLPQSMSCPAPRCGQVFHGPDSWDQRMEHVARHLEKAAAGKEDPVRFGGKRDGSLVEWASSEEVGIIKRVGGGGGDEGDGWELNLMLKRGGGYGVAGGQGVGQGVGGGTGGSMIMVSSTPATVAAATKVPVRAGNKRKAAAAAAAAVVKREEYDEVEVKNEIVVTSEDDDDGEGNRGEEIVVDHDAAVYGDEDDDLRDAEGEDDE